MHNNTSNTNKAGWKDLVNGGILQCVEAATLGMPFEVWKTRMGRFRNESTIEAFSVIYRRGGVPAFWQGTSAKMAESASKGAILLYSKEMLLTSMNKIGCNETIAGFIAGAGAGVCQTVVMGPSTFLITASVTGADKNTSILKKTVEVWKSNGIKGFYPGGSAIAFRQATNWASRQGLTEFIRNKLILYNHTSYLNTKNSKTNNTNDMEKINYDKDERFKLSVSQEALSGIIGGALSTWNQPFEVARIQMQAAANEGKQKQNILQVFNTIIRNDGVTGLFKGIVPRIGLAVWQTLFMVTGAKLIKQYFPW